MADDFLDNKGSIKLVGKPVKKDDKKGKSTLLNLMGEKKLICMQIILRKKYCVNWKNMEKKVNN